MTDPTQDPNKDDALADEIDWAAAMAEQAAGSNQSNQAEGLAEAADDWAAALAEQAAAETVQAPEAPAAASQPVASQNAPAAEAAKPAAAGLFKPLVDNHSDAQGDMDMIMDIPVQLTVELGRTRLTIRNILQLGQGSVVELDGLAGEPMDSLVNGYLIAQGGGAVVHAKYATRAP